MNAFFEHHKSSIEFGYRCFDRLLLNGLIQPFQQPERVLGFFNAYRNGTRVTRSYLTGIADQFQNWVTNRSENGALRFRGISKAAATMPGGINLYSIISRTPSPIKWWRS